MTENTLIHNHAIIRKDLWGQKPMAKSTKKTTSKSRAKSKAKTSTRAIQSPSPERNLTLSGLLLTGLGVVTALGLFSGQSTNLLTAVQTLVRKGFGWGAFVLPFLLLAAGLLILLRKMEGAPKLSTEQSIGISLLYLAGLTTLQYFTFPIDFQASRTIASSGSGGGYLGAYIMAPLQSAFGTAGTAIALFAWILLSLSLTLDIPVLDLFRWVPGFVQSLKTLFQKLFPPKEKPFPRYEPPVKVPIPDLKPEPIPESRTGPRSSDVPTLF